MKEPSWRLRPGEHQAAIRLRQIQRLMINTTAVVVLTLIPAEGKKHGCCQQIANGNWRSTVDQRLFVRFAHEEQKVCNIALQLIGMRQTGDREERPQQRLAARRRLERPFLTKV